MIKNKLLITGIIMITFLFMGCSRENVQYVESEKSEETESVTSEKEAFTLDREDPFLVFVNKDNPLPEDYVPENLVAIDGNLSSNQGISVNEKVYEMYLAMREAALEEDVHMVICSAYRSYGLQETLYNRYLSSRGEEWTKAHSAYPGTSEHQTGLAMDITSAEMGYGLDVSFEDTKEGIWLRENCADYGFVIRYMNGKESITGYTYEPWHIRYVGKEYANIIMGEGIVLEEFFNEISEE